MALRFGISFNNDASELLGVGFGIPQPSLEGSPWINYSGSLLLTPAISPQRPPAFMSPHDANEHAKTRSSSATMQKVQDSEQVASSELQGEKHDRSATQTMTSSEAVIVDWDGPDDPQNPKNWPKSRKWAATLIVALFTFVSPVASSMIAPGSQQVADEFGLKSVVQLDMITSIFVLGFAIGPLLMGPLSELYGRAVVVQLGNVFFLVWNLACGFAQNETQMIVFRFLAGIGGSAPLTIGGAVVGDTFNADERGRAIAIYALGPMIGPAAGPVVGAWIVERVSWRWVFWSTTIFDVAVQVVGAILLQETFAPVLLERKARKLEKAARADPEKGSSQQHRVFQTVYGNEARSWKYVLKTALTRPTILFLREPILQLLGVYMAFIYGIFYVFITTMPDIFSSVYHESLGIVGLNYIALGLGMMFASWVNSNTMDRIYMYYKRKNGNGEPEYRVPTLVPASVLFPVGLLMTGWAAQKHIHWIVTDIGIFFVGASMILAFQSIQVYIVDVFTLYAASGIAAVACLRALCGFGFPLFANAMFDTLGYGKGNTILACIAIVLGCPAPWILWFYGRRIRTGSKFARKT